jgi:hypothetical protein
VALEKQGDNNLRKNFKFNCWRGITCAAAIVLIFLPCFLLNANAQTSKNKTSSPNPVLAQIAFFRQVLRPDGNPAVGARVVIRHFSLADGTLTKEKTLLTDISGRFSTSAPDLPRNQVPDCRSGYLLIFASGCAPMFSSFTEWMRSVSAQGEPVRLQPAFTISGKAVSADGQAVAKAHLVPIDFRNNYSYLWNLNVNNCHIATPEVCAVSNARGEFRLPGFTLDLPHLPSEGFNSIPAVSLRATGSTNGVLLAGFDPIVFISPRPLGGDNPVTVVLTPARTVRGKVIDAVTQRPIAGAYVEAFPGNPSLPIDMPKTVTDRVGHFTLTGIISSEELYIKANRAPDWVNNWVPVSKPRPPADDPKEAKPEVDDNVIIPLRRWTWISGRVIDETGQPIRVPSDLNSIPLWQPDFVNMVCDQGYARTAADGTFRLRVAEGQNDLVRGGPGCYQWPKFTQADRIIPPGGRTGIVWRVKRLPAAFVMLFEFPPGKSEADYMFYGHSSLAKDSRPIPFTMSLSSYNHYLPASADKLNDTMFLQVIQIVSWNGNFAKQLHEIQPWLEVKANPQSWPTVVKLPL